MTSWWRWLRSWFSWQLMWETNHWVYWENKITGHRTIKQKLLPKGFIPGPPDLWWEKGYPKGETYKRLGPPPVNGSAVFRHQ